MSIRKKITQKIRTVLKKRQVSPDMPEDPKDLARAMFALADRKLQERKATERET